MGEHLYTYWNYLSNVNEFESDSSSIAIDTTGDVYVVYIEKPESLDPIVIVKKLNGNNGNVIWTNDPISAPEATNVNIAVDSSGYVYVAYHTSLSVISGSSSTGGSDVVILQLKGDDGDVNWMSPLSEVNTEYDDMYPKISISSNDNVYVSCLTILEGQSSDPDTYGISIHKVNPVNGFIISTFTHETGCLVDYDPIKYSIVAHSDTNDIVYIAYSKTIDQPATHNVICVVKISYDTESNGDETWEVLDDEGEFNTDEDNMTPSIAVDSFGNPYVAFITYGEVSEQTSAGEGDIVVFKLAAADGAIDWVVQDPSFNTVFTDHSPNIIVDAVGDPYIAYCTNDTEPVGDKYQFITIFKLSGVDGSFTWVLNQEPFNSLGNDRSPVMTLDTTGHIYLSYLSDDMSPSPNNIIVYKLGLQPPCFNYGTQILTLDVDMKPKYIPIQELKPGMIVSTYFYGPRKISMIGYSKMLNNPDNWRVCMYKMAKKGDMIDDLIITGGHSILVDNPPTGDELVKQKQYWGNKQYKIRDKYKILSSVSRDFEQIKTHDVFTYYHLVLEHPDPEYQFGIWANGVLTESQSKRHFIEHQYDHVETDPFIA